ncbi:hypothetical protein PUR34_12315 [Streptomyces sp. JV185]|nr:hypothetical protein [Streptomyces sp. JV185]MEE1768920.1 hypothetical protein [Streptomyces sp. JV185]
MSDRETLASVASVRRGVAAVLSDPEAIDGALYVAVAATPTPAR